MNDHFGFLPRIEIGFGDGVGFGRVEEHVRGQLDLILIEKHVRRRILVLVIAQEDESGVDFASVLRQLIHGSLQSVPIVVDIDASQGRVALSGVYANSCKNI